MEVRMSRKGNLLRGPQGQEDDHDAQSFPPGVHCRKRSQLRGPANSVCAQLHIVHGCSLLLPCGTSVADGSGHVLSWGLALSCPSHRCVMQSEEHTRSEPVSSLKIGVNPRLQVGTHDVVDMPCTIMPWPRWTRDTVNPGAQLLATCSFPLTALVLVLPAGTVQDPVTPERGADTGPRGATLHPRHRAPVLRLQRDGRETPVRLRNQGSCPSPTTACHPPHATKGKHPSPFI